jgi:hypothetical protein
MCLPPFNAIGDFPLNAILLWAKNYMMPTPKGVLGVGAFRLAVRGALVSREKIFNVLFVALI